MHGRVKTRSSEEQKEIKRKEREKKLKTYQEAMENVFCMRSKGIHNEQPLELTSGILMARPDIISLWNYRREIFLKMKETLAEEQYQKLLEKDLNLTEQCLRVNPKSYGSWHHRVWVLDNLPKADWKKEVALCNKYLELDERNFHCWDYKRAVVERANVPNMDEYNYTTQKIEVNFSNYSAWHLRSKLLPKIFPDVENKLPIIESKHKEEIELVQNAAFTDPYDQSAWFYQRWLLGLTEPNVHIILAERQVDSLIVALSKSIRVNDTLSSGIKLKVLVNDLMIDGSWEAVGTMSLLSSFLRFNFKNKISTTDLISIVLFEKSEETNKIVIPFDKVVVKKPNFIPIFSETLIEVLTEELSSCDQLLELEPESKWTLLTSVLLMQAIGSLKFEEDIRTKIKELMVIDPLRKGYYEDLASKFKIELALQKFYKECFPEEEIKITFPVSQAFKVTQENLTTLYHTQYLYPLSDIDLSGNNLTESSLKLLNPLQHCTTLILDSNKITSLKDLPILPKLQILSLSDNQVCSKESLNKLQDFPSLTKVILKNNPVCNEFSEKNLGNISFLF